jgi:hypothetical protein
MTSRQLYRAEVLAGLDAMAGERPAALRPHTGHCAYFIGTTAAIIAAAAIGAGGSIASSVIGSKAAKSAAETQSDAAAEAGKIATEAGEKGATAVEQAGQTASGDVKTATETAMGGVSEATEQGQEKLQGVYDTGQENLTPYLEAGKGAVAQVSDLMAPGGEFNRRFGMADYQEDPGYDFRMQEGQKALERSASARGRVLGGGTLKSLTRYSQGVASQEYQNAFDRFQQENAARYQRLMGLTSVGQTATGQANQLGEWYGSTAVNNLMSGAALKGGYGMEGARTSGSFLMGGAEGAGNLRMRGAESAAAALTGGANAKAAGQVGSANAWAQGIGGATGSIMNALLLSQLMNPKIPVPQSNYFGGG